MSNITETERARTDAAEATTRPPAEREPARGPVSDGLMLSFLVLVLGFGLCRAWIIFCLGAPIIAPSGTPSHWLYLAAGAIGSLAVALYCRHCDRAVSRMRTVLYRLSPAALLASGIFILVALELHSEPLMAAGLIVGGLGAGPLQVLWGDRFASHSVEFAAFASPAAAIVTAVVVALSAAHANFMSFIVVPLLSFGLLLFHGSRTGVDWKGALAPAPASAGDGDDENAGSSAAVATPAVSRRAVPLGVGKLMFSIMVFSLLCRMFDTVPT
ncbi:MAG: DNA-binding response regulator, partial [Adlercreutzia sp.]|nr:DNA-binding response regulator [Adlercreutzia sp.]